jgi:hypothetical protein
MSPHADAAVALAASLPYIIVSIMVVYALHPVLLARSVRYRTYAGSAPP